MYYATVHGIRPPFTVLVDGTFVQGTIVQKLAIKDELEKLLGGKVIVGVTDAMVAELRALGEPYAAAAIVARRLQRISIATAPTARTVSDIIVHAVKGGNPSKLCIATEDMALQQRLRKIPGVPLLRLARSSIVLDRPVREDAPNPHTQAELAHQLPTPSADLADKADRQAVVRQRKRPAAPNPLSCKKRKVENRPPSAQPPDTSPSGRGDHDTTTQATKRKARSRSRTRARSRTSKASNSSSQTQIP